MPRESRYDAFVKAREEQDLDRMLRESAPDGPARVSIGETSYVNFAGNDYLGLSRHPQLKERAAQWLESHGAGAGASRLVTGNLSLFSRIEEKIAALKGSESALVMASGFQTNAAVLQALFDAKVLGAEPLVFADRLNHASMHFGCAAAGVQQLRYRHCDLAHLAELLEAHGDDPRPKFILTESVFSMDGDIASIAEIAALAERASAYLVCDDAHATGVLGANGAGLSTGADLVIGTFSKALGGFGAYVACSAVMRSYLINCCSGLIYSTALPPAVLGAMDAALDLLPNLDEARAHVARLAATFRDKAARQGYDVGTIREPNRAAYCRRSASRLAAQRPLGASRPVGNRHPPAHRAKGARALADRLFRRPQRGRLGAPSGSFERTGSGASKRLISP